MIFVYLIIPVLFFILWIMARNMELDTDINEGGVSRELLKVSLFIYQKIRGKKLISWDQKVRGYLTTLGECKNLDKATSYYYAQKISIVLLLAFCGSILSLVLYISGNNDGALKEGGQIERHLPGDGERDVELVAKSEDGTKLGEFHVEVGEQKYTQKEADALFEEASSKLESEILGKNESLEKINDNLRLIGQMDGYPFEISWNVDNHDICKYDGEIDCSNVSAEGRIITLTATYTYNDHKWEQIIYAKVVPKELSPAQVIQKEIEELINTSNETSQYEKSMDLPEKYKEEKISWSEIKEDNSLLILLLMLVGGAATFVMKDKELKQKIDDRNAKLIREYPGIVSQIVLYLGAGMTMRNIFSKLSENYASKRKKGAPMSYAYEELTKSTREMKMGKSETLVYEDFGRRCGGQQYTRLSTLLSQNLRKGNSELLKLLSEESEKAFDDRLDLARKAGEEAGTRLLLPMILMLLIVMIIIMIPAYMTF
nr:hypothetical protein [uncultured Butyrivibrio sp.]